MNVGADVRIAAKSNPAGETAQDVKTGVSQSTSVSDSNQHTMDQKDDDQNDNTSESVLSSRCRLSMASATRAAADNDTRVRHPPTAPKSNKAKVEILPLTSAAEDVPKVSFKKKTQHSATAPQRGAEQQSAHPHKIKNY